MLACIAPASLGRQYHIGETSANKYQLAGYRTGLSGKCFSAQRLFQMTVVPLGTRSGTTLGLCGIHTNQKMYQLWLLDIGLSTVQEP